MVMSWIKDYKDKRTTAAEAVKVIASGHDVHIHPGCAEPISLVEAMTARAPELQGVRV